jgi:hypothetical protein
MWCDSSRPDRSGFWGNALCSRGKQDSTILGPIILGQLARPWLDCEVNPSTKRSVSLYPGMLSNPLLAFPSSKIGFFIISALFCYVLVAMSCRRPGGVLIESLLRESVRFDTHNVERLDCSDVKVVKTAGSGFSLVYTVLLNVPHDCVATYQPKFCMKAAKRSYFG